MISAQLTIPIDFVKQATVRLVIEIDLDECAAIEAAIDKAHTFEGMDQNWELKSLGRELASLRKQAEEAIAGLRFTAPE